VFHNIVKDVMCLFVCVVIEKTLASSWSCCICYTRPASVWHADSVSQQVDL